MLFRSVNNVTVYLNETQGSLFTTYALLSVTDVESFVVLFKAEFSSLFSIFNTSLAVAEVIVGIIREISLAVIPPRIPARMMEKIGNQGMHVAFLHT